MSRRAKIDVVVGRALRELGQAAGVGLGAAFTAAIVYGITAFIENFTGGLDLSGNPNSWATIIAGVAFVVAVYVMGRAVERDEAKRAREEVRRREEQERAAQHRLVQRAAAARRRALKRADNSASQAEEDRRRALKRAYKASQEDRS